MLAGSIQGVGGQTLIGGNLDCQAELFLDAFCDGLQVCITYIPQGYKVDELGVIFHDSLLLSFQAEFFNLLVESGAVDIEKTCRLGYVPVVFLEHFLNVDPFHFLQRLGFLSEG